MLFSTSSLGILSSVVAISVTSKRRPPRPRSAPPSPPLHLRTSKTTQLYARVGKHTVKTHSSRFERRAARGAGAEQRRASSSIGGERGRERSRSGGVALKSTGSRRRAHRSASPARAASRRRARCQLQPSAAPDLGRYLRHLNRPSHFTVTAQGTKTKPPRGGFVRIRSQYGRTHWE